MFIETSSLNLIPISLIVLGIKSLLGIARLLPAVATAEQKFGQVSRWDILPSHDPSTSQFVVNANM